MKTSEVLRAWARVLSGRTPSLSIEITRECPLACPGCYAYNEDHLNNGLTLRQVRDFKGQQLIDGVMALVEQHRPIHLSLVGGDPLVRLFELEELLPRITAMGVHCQVVTSAFRRIPTHWKENRHLNVVVSIDGLPAEHDERRKPATYERILRNIEGCEITVHCTVTRQMLQRPGYLREFMQFWSSRDEIRKIWVSLYTPQVGEISAERLTEADRRVALSDLAELREEFPKLDMPKVVIEALEHPPESPAQCTFARTTRTVSADLKTQITPCQFGGKPQCSECGCIASAGLHAIKNHRLAVGMRVGPIYESSMFVGETVARLRSIGVAAGRRS